MSSTQDVKNAARSLRNKLYHKSRDGGFIAERSTLRDLYRSVKRAVDDFIARPGSDTAANARAVNACEKADAAVDGLVAGNAASLEKLVQLTAKAVAAIEAATA